MSSLFESATAQVRPVAFARVALEQGIDTASGGLTYAVPPALAGLGVGERVRVPLGRGNKPVAGYVIQLADTCDVEGATVKFILSRDSQGLGLPPDLIELARWIAGYYCCPLGMVLAAMLPAAVKRGTGTVTQTLVGLPDGDGRADLPAAGRKADTQEGQEGSGTQAASVKLSPLQAAVLAAAQRQAQEGHRWTPIKQLADLAGARSVSPVKQLVDKGLLQLHQAQAVVSDLDLHASREPCEPSSPLTLTDGQRRALDHLVGYMDQGFGVHLLWGVTGSGKTEVYLRLIEQAINGGGSDICPSAIVLVPEIALTPQIVARFMSRFPDVAVLHSGLTAAQRHAQWRRIRQGQARIVIGARSAVFAPVPHLRLIIVDEEHESSYKQDQLPRYHARDVAIKRGQLLGIPVVLGSATPSLESYYNAVGPVGGASDAKAAGANASSKPGAADRAASTAQDAEPRRGRYHLVRLPQRVTGMRLPQVEVVDLQEERRQRRGVHLLSQRLEAELQKLFSGSGSGRGQAILLLNRRGYANYIACPDHRCGWMLRCEHCDVTAVYHKDQALPAGGVVRCHHCQAQQLLPAQCPVCQRRVTVFGLGTQRVEEELKGKFPGIRAVRMDSDSMRRARDYQDTLDQFRLGRIDVLLGTQMIAKGLDFPGVRLVGVISADTSLHLPDFRAAERTFQLISQVAGRAGRSDQSGRVIVQTFNPDDAAIQLAARHDYETFAQRELRCREQVGLPPVWRMARIVVRDRDHLACLQRATELAGHLERFNRQLQEPVRLRGPMPCPIARIAGYHRHQIELLAAPPQAAQRIQELLTALRNTRLLVSDAHTAVDVDPVALL